MLAGVDGGGFSGGGVVTKYFCAWNEMRTCQYSIAEGVRASCELAGVRLGRMIEAKSKRVCPGYFAFSVPWRSLAGLMRKALPRGVVPSSPGRGFRPMPCFLGLAPTEP